MGVLGELTLCSDTLFLVFTIHSVSHGLHILQNLLYYLNLLQRGRMTWLESTR